MVRYSEPLGLGVSGNNAPSSISERQIVNAILQNGIIVPTEPIPESWPNGQRLEISPATEIDTDIDIDAWAEEINRLCADSSPEDEELMRQAIEEQRRIGKEQVRRQMDKFRDD